MIILWVSEIDSKQLLLVAEIDTGLGIDDIIEIRNPNCTIVWGRVIGLDYIMFQEWTIGTGIFVTLTGPVDRGAVLKKSLTQRGGSGILKQPGKGLK
jgi:hypothetical protein